MSHRCDWHESISVTPIVNKFHYHDTFQLIKTAAIFNTLGWSTLRSVSHCHPREELLQSKMKSKFTISKAVWLHEQIRRMKWFLRGFISNTWGAHSVHINKVQLDLCWSFTFNTHNPLCLLYVYSVKIKLMFFDSDKTVCDNMRLQ